MTQTTNSQVSLTFNSVCSGIEAATVAWKGIFSPLTYAEIDPFCCRLLAHHYPETPNLGDITRHPAFPHADILIGGTPCQSFSIAGLRKGLDDPRGNLALEFLRIVDRSRPAWVVWENVPGVLSIDSGRAFGSILGGLGKLGYGLAYRVLDAQYFGVPQRRRRVFLVGHLGDWRPAAAVLFERACLSGHPPPCRPQGQDLARSLTSGSGGGRYDRQNHTIAAPLRQVPYADNVSHEANLVPTIASRTRGGGGLGTDAECDGALIPTTSPALKARDYKGPSSDGDGAPLIPIAFNHQSGGSECMISQLHNLANSLQRCQTQAVFSHSVRRLTPLECERLQGFPDHYTAIPNSSDSPRYRAIGNSIATPVLSWIAHRITSLTP